MSFKKTLLLEFTDFKDFPGPPTIFKDFLFLENVRLKFKYFPGFPVELSWCWVTVFAILAEKKTSLSSRSKLYLHEVCWLDFKRSEGSNKRTKTYPKYTMTRNAWTPQYIHRKSHSYVWDCLSPSSCWFWLSRITWSWHFIFLSVTLQIHICQRVSKITTLPINLCQHHKQLFSESVNASRKNL